jgi:hypothetical protein
MRIERERSKIPSATAAQIIRNIAGRTRPFGIAQYRMILEWVYVPDLSAVR